ncbi:integration host factor subunit alpha [Dissulfurirhabdus thermomarina]|uniref:Integration host factor subunit alpha n=1 Tax=Dissulfurirhabdus thermomarina TaxID=1765737 RepID=A0A6N9TJ53_DISTH|nr:integration host factor subunit alpha [Dissulfurirhabdus thermomarina]NDY41282.1 integration host factor subunit alpha [Dissulfurirhabdus thermomarina]NMX23739.1 integration host factor subunit alpha [Dissulfurirhabdus thermomarina]
MTTLTKRKIAEAVSERLGFSVRCSLKLVEALCGEIKAALRSEEKVKIVRFGTFSAKEKGARRCINPVTGEPILIAPRRTVVFHPSRNLKAAVNGRGGLSGTDRSAPRENPLP